MRIQPNRAAKVQANQKLTLGSTRITKPAPEAQARPKLTIKLNVRPRRSVAFADVDKVRYFDNTDKPAAAGLPVGAQQVLDQAVKMGVALVPPKMHGLVREAQNTSNDNARLRGELATIQASLRESGANLQAAQRALSERPTLAQHQRLQRQLTSLPSRQSHALLQEDYEALLHTNHALREQCDQQQEQIAALQGELAAIHATPEDATPESITPREPDNAFPAIMNEPIDAFEQELALLLTSALYDQDKM